MTDDEKVLGVIRDNPGLTGQELVREGCITVREAAALFRLEFNHKIYYAEGWYACQPTA